jgi:hypothetical protein
MLCAKLCHDTVANSHLDRRDYVELDFAGRCVSGALVGSALLTEIVKREPIASDE